MVYTFWVLSTVKRKAPKKIYTYCETLILFIRVHQLQSSKTAIYIKSRIEEFKLIFKLKHQVKIMFKGKL